MQGERSCSPSPLADATANRNLRGAVWLPDCRRQAPGQHRVYSLDATVTSVPESLSEVSKGRKLHLILDHAGHIPSFSMTPGREHEIEVARPRYEPDRILMTGPTWTTGLTSTPVLRDPAEGRALPGARAAAWAPSRGRIKDSSDREGGRVPRLPATGTRRRGSSMSS